MIKCHMSMITKHASINPPFVFYQLTVGPRFRGPLFSLVIRLLSKNSTIEIAIRLLRYNRSKFNVFMDEGAAIFLRNNRLFRYNQFDIKGFFHSVSEWVTGRTSTSLRYNQVFRYNPFGYNESLIYIHMYIGIGAYLFNLRFNFLKVLFSVTL